MKSKPEYRIGIGASSILMILVVLALSALSLLSLYSARSNAALSRRNLVMAAGYYHATAAVQAKLSLLDSLLAEYAAETDGASAWNTLLQQHSLAELSVAPDLTFSFAVDAGAGRYLSVEGILTPGATPRYRLTQHKLINQTGVAQDSPLQVFMP